jgi:hypothetical protein
VNLRVLTVKEAHTAPTPTPISPREKSIALKSKTLSSRKYKIINAGAYEIHDT